MSQLSQQPEQDEATVVGRTLVFVHQMIDQNFPNMVNQSKQFTKTVLSGDEVTPVAKPASKPVIPPTPPVPQQAPKPKKPKPPRQAPKKKNKKLVSRPKSKKEPIGDFSSHGSSTTDVSEYYKFPKRNNTFGIIISLTFLALAVVIAYILFR